MMMMMMKKLLYCCDKHVSDVITPAPVKCLLSSRHTCSLQGAESVRMKPLCDWWCDVRRCWGEEVNRSDTVLSVSLSVSLHLISSHRSSSISRIDTPTLIVSRPISKAGGSCRQNGNIAPRLSPQIDLHLHPLHHHHHVRHQRGRPQRLERVAGILLEPANSRANGPNRHELG